MKARFICFLLVVCYVCWQTADVYADRRYIPEDEQDVIENQDFSNLTDADDGMGGAVSNWGSVTIKSSSFSSNGLGYGGMGGAIYNNGAMVIENGTFHSNYVGEYGYGGAIYNFEDLTINNSSFLWNATGEYGYGGAIEAAYLSLNINGTTFGHNSAGLAGGALHIGNGAEVHISGGEFFSNSATYGGAIATEEEYGESGSTLDVVGTVFRSNSATQGGALLNQAANFSITNAYFESNYADDSGGAIMNNNVMSVVGSQFIGNTSNKNGGAIYNDDSGELTLTNVVFKDNYADQSGGAIYMIAGDVDVSQSVFTNNWAIMYGGAVFQDDDYGYLSIENSVFDKNAANVGGGAIAVMDAAVMSDVTFRENTSFGNGGALYVARYGDVTISGVTFESNTARVNGGAIYINGTNATVEISDAVFQNNSAKTGGAIYNVGSLILTGENIFVGNTAGGVANDIFNIGTMTVNGGMTVLDGGIDGGGTLIVENGAVLNLNTGVIHQGDISISNSKIQLTLNHTGAYGRVISDGTLDITDTEIEIVSIASEGVYNILQYNNNARATVAYPGVSVDDVASKLFDIYDDNAGTVTVSAKSASDIASGVGVSMNAANAVGALVRNAGLYEMSLAAQAAMSGDNLSVLENEIRKLHPESGPVIHSMAARQYADAFMLASRRMNAMDVCGYVYGDEEEFCITPGFGLWARGLVGDVRHDNRFGGNMRGGAVGFDGMNGYGFGLGVGYMFNDIDLNSSGRDIDIEEHTVFAYAQYKPDSLYISASVGYGISQYKENTDFFGIDISSRYNVHSLGGQVSGGYEFDFGLTPEVGLRYVHISPTDYSNEFGSVDVQDTDYMTGLVGFRFAPQLYVDDAFVFGLDLQAAATYDIISDSGSATISVDGATPYDVGIDSMTRFGTESSVGVSGEYYGLRLGLTYRLITRGDYLSNGFMLNARYAF